MPIMNVNIVDMSTKTEEDMMMSISIKMLFQLLNALNVGKQHQMIIDHQQLNIQKDIKYKEATHE